MQKRIQSADSQTFDSEAHKMLETKDDSTLAGLIRGMRDVDRVQEWIVTEAQGQGRKEIIASLNRKKAELEE